MVDCATDQARHRRLLDLTGYDTAVLTEIAVTMDAICTQEMPDLEFMGRLAVHRDHLTERYANIPTKLPAVWDAIGQPTRAEALARAITDPQRRDRALSDLVKEVAGRGDHAQARTLARSITDPEEQQRAYVWTVLAGQRVSDRTEIYACDDTRPSDEDQAWALEWARARTDEQAGTGVEVGTAPDTDDLGWAWALELADAADEDDEDDEKVVWAHADPDGHELAWANRFPEDEDEDETEYETGVKDEYRYGYEYEYEDEDDEKVVWADADPDDDMTWDDTDPTEEDEAWMLQWFAAREHELGEISPGLSSDTDTDTDDLGWSWAEERIAAASEVDDGPEPDISPDEQGRTWVRGSDTSSHPEVQALINRATVAARAGDHHLVAASADRAETLTEHITYPDLRARALGDLATILAGQGNHDRAEALALRITDSQRQAAVFSSLARMAAGRGDHGRAGALAEQAETVARSITNPHQRASELVSLLEAVAAAEDRDRVAAVLVRAAVLTRRITDPSWRVWELVRMVPVVAAVGDHGRAIELADQAAELAQSNVDAWWQRQVVIALARLGEHHRAEALVAAIGDRSQQARALIDLAKEAADAGRRDQAAALVDRAEPLATSTRWSEASWAVARLAAVVADLGDHDRAAGLVDAITEPHLRAEALVDLAELAVGAGHRDRAAALVDNAERVAKSITDQYFQSFALADLPAVVAALGNHDRATAIARSITNPERRVAALTAMATALARVGDFDQAEQAARLIANPYAQSLALASLADKAADAYDHGRAAALTDLAEDLANRIADRDRRARALCALVKRVEPGRARRLIAQAFGLGSWTTPLHALVQVQPAAVLAVADERLSLDDGECDPV